MVEIGERLRGISIITWSGGRRGRGGARVKVQTGEQILNELDVVFPRFLYLFSTTFFVPIHV